MITRFPTRRHGPVLRRLIVVANFFASGSMPALAVAVSLAGLVMWGAK